MDWPRPSPRRRSRSAYDSTETKAFRSNASLGLGGLDIRIDVEPDFISEVLELYAKFANAVAIPMAQFFLAVVWNTTKFEGEAKELATKWLLKEKKIKKGKTTETEE